VLQRSNRQVHAVPQTEPPRWERSSNAKEAMALRDIKPSSLLSELARSCIGRIERSNGGRPPQPGSKNGKRNLPNPARSNDSKRPIPPSLLLLTATQMNQ